jgi:hypothetical protein
MRWWLPLSLVFIVSVSTALATPSPASDRVFARALVVRHTDVPASWDRRIATNPCPITWDQEVRVSARAATRWGSQGPNGVWSVAVVASSTPQAKRLFEHVTSVLPSCIARVFAPGSRTLPNPSGVVAVPPRSLTQSSSITPISYGRLGDAAAAWNITSVIRNDSGRIIDKYRMDVVVVRTGRAVFWDELGTYFSYSSQTDVSGRQLNDRILHNALHRAHRKPSDDAPTHR